MAMNATAMAAAIRGHQTATPSPNEGPSPDGTYADKMLVALCQGIIDNIISGATIATTSGAPDSEHTGNVTS